MAKKKPVIYIVGPTASGKTSISVELAKKFGGEIISGDSMQIYKGMHIATAAPDESEKQGIPHHLFEFLEPSEKFSVSQYVKMADEVIKDIFSRGKIPFVVGGTGLYMSALSEHLDFGDDSPNEDIRKSLEKRAEEYGLETLYQTLTEIDPKAAEKISPNDKKRILRAIEVYEISGKTKTQRDKYSKISGPVYDNLVIGLTYVNRETLYNRINQRVDIMLENGILEEAGSALGKISGTAAQAIGHKEFAEYLY
ncbi:MAG: tRNA (adenosine(37)-N6)-dimethylallyltransferase MiaA, partial [Acutalibacteraceae bacterium]|nr:tRNA (adenosine(37)-N6)-dimethylallyltransferase MiaA [Acutalibacteraceae bacterium]